MGSLPCMFCDRWCFDAQSCIVDRLIADTLPSRGVLTFMRSASHLLNVLLHSLAFYFYIQIFISLPFSGGSHPAGHIALCLRSLAFGPKRREENRFVAATAHA